MAIPGQPGGRSAGRSPETPAAAFASLPGWLVSGSTVRSAAALIPSRTRRRNGAFLEHPEGSLSIAPSAASECFQQVVIECRLVLARQHPQNSDGVLDLQPKRAASLAAAHVLREASSRGFGQGSLKLVGHELRYFSAREGCVSREAPAHGVMPPPERESTQCPLEKRGALQFAQHSWAESSWSAQGRRRNAATSFAKASWYWKRKPCAESG
jgi:hypothetical protein